MVLFTPICYGLLRPDRFMGGHKVPGFNLWALNCWLTLKYCICIESIQLAMMKKKLKKIRKKTRYLIFKIFLEISDFFCYHKNVRHLAKFQYVELLFFANILSFIELIDSTKKTSKAEQGHTRVPSKSFPFQLDWKSDHLVTFLEYSYYEEKMWQTSKY